MVAQGLASLLRDDFDLVGTVGDGKALIDAAQRLRPDVIVADMAMPVMDWRRCTGSKRPASTPKSSL
jgi:CheY-like chemotaxis protein